MIAARGLPDTDNMFFGIGKLIDKKVKTVTVMGGINLQDVTDPFVAGYLGHCKILMTSVKVPDTSCFLPCCQPPSSCFLT